MSDDQTRGPSTVTILLGIAAIVFALMYLNSKTDLKNAQAFHRCLHSSPRLAYEYFNPATSDKARAEIWDVCIN